MPQAGAGGRPFSFILKKKTIVDYDKNRILFSQFVPKKSTPALVHKLVATKPYWHLFRMSVYRIPYRVQTFTKYLPTYGGARAFIFSKAFCRI